MKNVATSTLILLLFIISAAGQTRSAASKFDEFTDKSDAIYFFEDDVSFKERVDRFIKQLKTERASKAYIIHYRARVSKYHPNMEQFASRTKWEIVTRTPLQQNDVIVIDGGLREENTLEFWMGGQRSQQPKPTPSVWPTYAVTCPSLGMTTSPQFKKTASLPLRFTKTRLSRRSRNGPSIKAR